MPALGGGLVYGIVWGLGLLLLGRDPLGCFLFGLLGALLWTGIALLVRGPLTRWRNRRASGDWPAVEDGEKEG